MLMKHAHLWKKTINVVGSTQHILKVSANTGGLLTKQKSMVSMTVQDYTWKVIMKYDICAFIGSDPEETKWL